MRMLHRYILLELLKVFSVALAVITLFMVLVGIYRVAHDQGLGIAQVTPLIPYLLPDALRFAIPGTILFAACSVYGRLAGMNELVAIKASGISPMVVVWPAYILTFFLSLFAVWLNDVGVVWGHESIQRFVVAEVEDIAYSMLRTQRAYSTKRFSINIKGIEGRKLIMPMLWFAANADSPPITLTAQEAEMRSDPEAKTLNIVFPKGCTVEVEGQASLYLPDPFERIMPLEDASRSTRPNSPAWIPMSRIPAEIQRRQELIVRRELDLSAQAAFAMVTGDFEALTGDALKAGETSLRDEANFIPRLYTEPTRRWANGFSCLCFVMVGAPLAMRWKNADFWFIFLACFGPILIVYYPLLAYGVDAAKRGSMTPHVVWLGNIILVGWGVWLLRKVLRY